MSIDMFPDAAVKYLIENTPDWSVLDIEGVLEVADNAAAKVSGDYSDFVDYDDVYQDALVILATRFQDTGKRLEEGLGFTLGTLYYELTCDLVDKVRPLSKRETKVESLDVIVASGDEDALRPVEVVVRSGRDTYTREEVESLMPAVWDESYCYGLPLRDDAPDPDMPKGTPNKAHGNLLSAVLADIKDGWAKAPLSEDERRSVLLCYGLDWTQRQAAFNQGVSVSTINERLFRGVGKIVATLNGNVFSEVLAA